jgi:hypothetical protein
MMKYREIVRDDLLIGYYEYVGEDHDADHAASRRRAAGARIGTARHEACSPARLVW